MPFPPSLSAAAGVPVAALSRRFAALLRRLFLPLSWPRCLRMTSYNGDTVRISVFDFPLRTFTELGGQSSSPPS